MWELVRTTDGNTSGRRDWWGLTNLMATVWELRRFVPGARMGSGWKEWTGGEWEKGKQTFENDTEGALADLPANAVVAANEVWRGGVVLGGHGGREEEGDGAQDRMT